jgi:hypothetical protein
MFVYFFPPRVFALSPALVCFSVSRSPILAMSIRRIALQKRSYAGRDWACKRVMIWIRDLLIRLSFSEEGCVSGSGFNFLL